MASKFCLLYARALQPQVTIAMKCIVNPHVTKQQELDFALIIPIGCFDTIWAR